jgi:hypothetical protein
MSRKMHFYLSNDKFTPMYSMNEILHYLLICNIHNPFSPLLLIIKSLLYFLLRSLMCMKYQQLCSVTSMARFLLC